MTRDEAERVLATRGLTPCVRFYRRPDGTVMTTDCPSGARREGRRLAVLASSLAAGAALAAPSSARAEPAPDPTVETPDSAAPDNGSVVDMTPPPAAALLYAPELGTAEAVGQPATIDGRLAS